MIFFAIVDFRFLLVNLSQQKNHLCFLSSFHYRALPCTAIFVLFGQN